MGRWSEALWDFLFSVTKGSGYLKGEQFEKWIETAFFPPDKYTLVHRTPNEPTNAERFVESSKYPDFKFRDLATEKEFWVEAKYRGKWYGSFPNQYIYFIKDWQLDRYRKYDKDLPLFSAIGVGGEADDPNQIYLIPVKAVKMADRIYKKYLVNYEIDNVFKDPNKTTDDLSLSSVKLWKRQNSN